MTTVITTRLPVSAPLARSGNVARISESKATTKPMTSENEVLKKAFDNGSFYFRLLLRNIWKMRRGKDQNDTAIYLVIMHYHKLEPFERGLVRDELDSYHPHFYVRLKKRNWEWSQPVTNKKPA